jgi:hypothetical protein
VLQNGYLTSGSNDYTINIWNPIDGTLKRTIPSSASALIVLQNGDLASGSADATIKFGIQLMEH